MGTRSNTQPSEAKRIGHTLEARGRSFRACLHLLGKTVKPLPAISLPICAVDSPFRCGRLRGARFRECFVTIVLREATVSTAKENACSVGTATNPARSRRRIGSGEVTYADGKMGCQNWRRFLCVVGCLPFGRGERGLCVGRAIDRHGARPASTGCVLSSFFRG